MRKLLSELNQTRRKDGKKIRKHIDIIFITMLHSVVKILKKSLRYFRKPLVHIACQLKIIVTPTADIICMMGQMQIIIYLNAKVSQPFYIRFYFSMVHVRIF